MEIQWLTSIQVAYTKINECLESSWVEKQPLKSESFYYSRFVSLLWESVWSCFPLISWVWDFPLFFLIFVNLESICFITCLWNVVNDWDIMIYLGVKEIGWVCYTIRRREGWDGILMELRVGLDGWCVYLWLV